MTDDDLTQRLRYLRNAAPQQYGEFCGAFDRYLQGKLAELAQTEGNVHVAQGKAQMCMKLSKLFNDVQKVGVKL